MGEEQKTLKQYCKEAKKRLKQGFWQAYHKGLNEELTRAKEEGISQSKIKEYYTQVVTDNIRNHQEEDEIFYRRVKKLLDEEGEVSDAIGRLTDKTEFDSLSYEEKQRYTLSLSEKYLKAVERYRKERELNIKNGL